MPEFTIYHNPRCSKSRDSLALLLEAGMKPTVIEYLKDPPDLEGLKKLRVLLDVPASAMVRTKEKAWEDTGLDSARASEEEILGAIVKDPGLMERPVVVRDGRRAVIGRPAERVRELL